MDYWTIIISAVTAAIGWFSNKVLSKREKGASNVDIVDKVNLVVSSFLDTNNKLAQYNEELHEKLLKKEKEISDLQAEREDLRGEIKCLKNKLNRLNKRLNDLENEKNNVNPIGFNADRMQDNKTNHTTGKRK